MSDLARRPAAKEPVPMVVRSERTTDQPLGDSPQQPSPAEPGEDGDHPGRQDGSKAPASGKAAVMSDQTPDEENARGDGEKGVTRS